MSRTKTIRMQAGDPERLQTELCVVGSGVAGIAAAICGARLGLKTLLVEHMPQVGGQAFHALIGTFCGFY